MLRSSNVPQRRGFTLIWCIGLLACGTVACASGAPSLSRTTAAIDAQIGDSHLEREEHIKLGPVSLSLLRTLVRLAGDEVDEEARAILSDVNHLEVATYRLHPAVNDSRRIDLGELEHELRADGWTRVISTRDDGETTMVMVNEDAKGRVRGMFVVTLDRDELEVVHLEGTLDRALALALTDSGAIAKVARHGS